MTLIQQKQIALIDVLKAGPVGFIAGVIGGVITSSIPDAIMKTIAIILLLLVFLFTFIKPKPNPHSNEKSVKELYPIFFGMGVYNGAFGPGQGSILMHYLTRKGIDYLKVIGLTRANTLASGLGAVITYILSGYMDWSIAIALTAGGIIGGQIAVFIAPKMSKKFVRVMMRAIVFLLIIQLLAENLIRGVLS